MASGSLTHDLYAQIYNPNMGDTQATLLCRRITIVMALIALCISMMVAFLSPDRTIFWFAVFGWSGIGATFCPMILLSLFGQSLLSGRDSIYANRVSMTLISKFFLQEIDGVGDYIAALETMPPSFLSALLVGYFVTVLWPDIALEERYSSN